MKTLKEQLAAFNEVAKEIELDRFYYISITEYKIQIQGNFKQLDYCKNLTEMVLKKDYDCIRYEGTYKGIEIVLI